jgi:hypothetical protein
MEEGEGEIVSMPARQTKFKNNLARKSDEKTTLRGQVREDNIKMDNNAM